MKNRRIFNVELNVFYIIIWLRIFGNEGVGCVGLNENGPQRFLCLNTWSPVDETVWKD